MPSSTWTPCKINSPADLELTKGRNMINGRKLPEYVGWSGRCLTAVICMLSGSKQLQKEPETSNKSSSIRQGNIRTGPQNPKTQAEKLSS